MSFPWACTYGGDDRSVRSTALSSFSNQRSFKLGSLLQQNRTRPNIVAVTLVSSRSDKDDLNHKDYKKDDTGRYSPSWLSRVTTKVFEQLKPLQQFPPGRKRLHGRPTAQQLWPLQTPPPVARERRELRGSGLTASNATAVVAKIAKMAEKCMISETVS
ncbi:hypothetical protein HYDPIDRAFT_166042 [Hydnomerulius pinastri MD-312]|nr:hypothetical protein HYDPIDRAFT_166042 [Hydnomerulius pinastri MD-312]